MKKEANLFEENEKKVKSSFNIDNKLHNLYIEIKRKEI